MVKIHSEVLLDWLFFHMHTVLSIEENPVGGSKIFSNEVLSSYGRNEIKLNLLLITFHFYDSFRCGFKTVSQTSFCF